MSAKPKVYQFEKLYELLSLDEQAQFRKWLEASLNQRQQTMWKLFEIWRIGNPWKTIERQLKLPAGREKARLSHLRGELQEKLEDFLTIHALMNQPHTKASLLANELVNRNAGKLFPLLFRKVNRQLKNQLTRDSLYLRTRYERAEIEQGYLVKFLPEYRKKEDLIEERMRAWLDWVLVEGTELALHSAQKKSALGQQLGSMLSQLTSLLPGEKPQVLMIYQQILALYESQAWSQPGPQASAEQLVRQLKESKQLFHPTKLANLHLLLFNYFIRRVYYQQEAESFARLMELYQWNVEDRLWPHSRQIYRTVQALFAQMIELATDSKAKSRYLEEAITFLESSYYFLPKEEQEDARQLNEAMLHFATREYERVKVQRLTAHFSDPFYEIGYRMLELQARYEMQDWENLPDALHSLRQRIHQGKRLSDLQKQAYFNRLSFFNRLVQLAENNMPIPASFLSELQQIQPLSGRIWLEKKVKERMIQTDPERKEEA